MTWSQSRGGDGDRGASPGSHRALEPVLLTSVLPYCSPPHTMYATSDSFLFIFTFSFIYLMWLSHLCHTCLIKIFIHPSNTTFRITPLIIQTGNGFTFSRSPVTLTVSISQWHFAFSVNMCIVASGVYSTALAQRTNLEKTWKSEERVK